MADLLVRDLDDATKEMLAARAVRNNRSQQAEARAILEDALNADSRSWIVRLRRAAMLADGIDFEPPARHYARDVDVEEWL